MTGISFVMLIFGFALGLMNYATFFLTRSNEHSPLDQSNLIVTMITIATLLYAACAILWIVAAL